MRIGIDARLIDEKVKFGIHVYQHNLVEELANIDKKNEYFLFFQSLRRERKDLPGPNQVNFKKIAIRIPNFFESDIKDRIWADFLLARNIKKNKIDVFHTLCTSFPTKKYKCKTVVTIHDLTHKLVDSQKKMKRIFALKSFERSIYDSDKIITVSQNSKNDILRFYAIRPEKINVIYLGRNKNIKKLSVEDIKNFRIKKGLIDKFILYCGYLLPHKNVEKIIESFKIAKKKYGINHKLLLIGGRGILKERIRNLVNLSGLQKEIFIIDYVDNKEINLFYNVADLFLFPSLYEGFGMPVLEAMAASLPVITSDVSSLPEVAGDAALLVNPNNCEEIASAIGKIVNNGLLREQLVKRGIAQVIKFCWEKTALETLKVYQSLS